ncbi:FliH/SctL family protein [Acinetobacter modestus]|uniref:FliH/SctL family protein n=1 Tax=Acinetobacter modestus TaxID=1776740 RepID=UPI003019E906
MSTRNKEPSVLLKQVQKAANTITLGQVQIQNPTSNEQGYYPSRNEIDSSKNLSQIQEQENNLKVQQKELAVLKETYELEYNRRIESEKLTLKRLHDQQLSLLESQFKAKMNTLNSCIAEFDRSLKDLNSSIEKISVKVIDSILEKMVFSLSGHEKFIIDVIKKAVYQHNLGNEFILKTPAVDFDMVKNIIEDACLEAYKITIEKDSSLISGQLIVELNNSAIDIGFSQQVNNVRQLLNDE